MINPNNITFSVNFYDQDGDKVEDCVFIHLENGVILSFSDVEDIQTFIKGLQNAVAEIKETYGK